MKFANLSLATVAISLFGATSSFAASIAQWEPVKDGSAVPSTADSSSRNDSAWVAYSNGGVYFTSNSEVATPSWTRMDMGTNMGQPFDMKFSKTVTAIASADSFDDYNAFVAMHSEKYYSTLYRCTYSRGSISWKELAPFAFTDIEGVSVNPLARGRVYVTSSSAVHYSTDFGDTWQASSAGDPLLPPSGSAVSAVSASNINRADWIVVGTVTGEVWMVFRARSGAGSWVRLDQGRSAILPDRIVTRVQIDDNMSPPAILAVYGGTNDQSTWISVNGGRSFMAAQNPVIGTAMKPSVLSASLSPNSGDRTLYSQILGYGGVYSDDYGTTWSRSPR